ncbi:hypothetical protein CDD82_3206 [Ophiocordyceps australis]|uniref:Uncharacterized protein n=1 Tax=Ophiocordyceps australis TaxID=1399860 RepID=A0A2C5ZAM6_9HYPO|nr:hypothetical protein CDD82_3206 [Ophiocordyceps australis]
MRVSCGSIRWDHGVNTIGLAASMAARGSRWPEWNHELSQAIVHGLPDLWIVEYGEIFGENITEIATRVHTGLQRLEMRTYTPTIDWLDINTQNKTEICWPTFFDGYPDDFETFFGFLSSSLLQSVDDTPLRFMDLPPGAFSKTVPLVIEPATLDCPLWIDNIDDFIWHNQVADTTSAWFGYVSSELDRLGTRFGRLLFIMFERDYGCQSSACARWASQGTYFRPVDALHALLFIRDRLLAGQPFLVRFGNMRVVTDLFMMDLYGLLGKVPPKQPSEEPPSVAIGISTISKGPSYELDDMAVSRRKTKRSTAQQRQWGRLSWAAMDGVSITLEFASHAVCHGRACGQETVLGNHFAFETWNVRGIINAHRLMTGRSNAILGPGKLVGRYYEVEVGG